MDENQQGVDSSGEENGSKLYIDTLPSDIKEALQKEMQSIIQTGYSIDQKLGKFAEGIWKLIQFNAELVINVDLSLQIPNPTQSPICSATCGSKGKKTFKCYDCYEADNMIQCLECFQKADHKGHHYIQSLSGEGCCDCGNEEMMNPKGFCPKHSKKNFKIHIPPEIRDNFFRQGTFYFYVTYWLLERAQAFSLNEMFVHQQSQKFFQVLVTIAGENYDSKVLIHELMKQNLRQVFSVLPELSNSKLTILQKVFHFKNSQFMKQFCRVTYEIFPVQESRIDIIRQYFKKTNSDPSFHFHHPLRLLNFQFMTCIKMICSLIMTNEIEPIKIPPFHQYPEFDHLWNQVLLKFVDDMQYGSGMKGASAYHNLLIERCNVAEQLLFYRQLRDQQVCKQKIDEYFLKTFKYVIRNVRKNKKNIQKFIKQLWIYLNKPKKPSLSLIHQRLFAYSVFAYLDGHLEALCQPEKLKNFMSLLKVNEGEKENLFVRLIQYHLSNSVSCLAHLVQDIPNDYVEYYFTAQNSEHNLSFKLDFIYQKLLIMMSDRSINYLRIIFDLAQSQYEDPLLRRKYIVMVASFVNCLLTVDADELEIKSTLQIKDKAGMDKFYGQFISLLKQQKAIAIKHKAGKIIDRKESFDQFVKDCCDIQKGYLKTKQTVLPLQYLAYDFYFKTLEVEGYNLSDSPPTLTPLSYLKNKVFWSEERIEWFIIMCSDSFQMSNKLEKSFEEFNFTPSRMGSELIKIYLLTQSPDLKKFFEERLLELAQQYNCSLLYSSLKKIVNFQESTQLIQLVEEGAERKNNKFLQKKRELQLRFKQKKEVMLAKHSSTANIQEENGQICIYCKEVTENPLRILAQVTLDTFFNHQILKLSQYRLCFRTCSHKVHENCFLKLGTDVQKQCCLCRRPTNFLLPDFKGQQADFKSEDFEEYIYLKLIQQNSYSEDKYLKIEKFRSQYCEGSMTRAFLNALISEIALFGTHEPMFAKHNIVPIYSQLIKYLKMVSKDCLLHDFQTDRKMMKVEGEEAKLYCQIRETFERYLFEAKEGKQQVSKAIDQINEKIQQTIALMDGVKQIGGGAIFPVLIPAEKYLYVLPKRLPELQYLMGKCPSCSKMSESICLCLVCGYRLCIREKNVLLEHFYSHGGNTIFIRCDTGMPIYNFKNDYLFMRRSIYLNYLGEPFENSAMVKKDVGEYVIDSSKYEVMRQKIVENEVRLLVIQELS